MGFQQALDGVSLCILAHVPWALKGKKNSWSIKSLVEPLINCMYSIVDTSIANNTI